jgi:MerR family copper efflux transcriptional regulator
MKPNQTTSLPVFTDSPQAMQATQTTQSTQASLRVGDLAKRTGKTVRALHLYEELDLLEPLHRSKGGYRLYSDESVKRVRWIEKLQDMGFSLPEIRTLIAELGKYDSASRSMQKVSELFQSKLHETRQQLAKLQSLVGELEASLDYLTACTTTCDPDTLLTACQACRHHDCGQHPPELVAGFQPH